MTTHTIKAILTATLILSVAATGAAADNVADKHWHQVALHMPSDWYASAEAHDIADRVLGAQMDNGGWPKNIDFNSPDCEAKLTGIDRAGEGSTIDNGATTVELRYLARMLEHNPDSVKYRQAIVRGLNFIFDAQYDNGGWPQFWPVRHGHSVAYSGFITYNDNAMVNVMKLLDDVAVADDEFSKVTLCPCIKERCREAFDKGVECILNTQIVVDGRPTVWCAQHNPETLAPEHARAFEPASYSGSESVGIVRLLMNISKPSPRVMEAVAGAVQWLEDHKIADMRYEFYTTDDGHRSSRLVPQPGHNVWARFYDLDTEQPVFCDRDSIKRPRLEDIGYERRGGYAWYVDAAQEVIDRYPQWLAKKQAKLHDSRK